MGVFFVYILKSSVCLALLYLFFKLLLSKETFHRFNRVVVLSALLLSLLIPLVEVKIEQQTEVTQTVLTLEQLLLLADMANTSVSESEATIAFWIKALLFVYLAGILFFACRHLYSLIRLGWLLRSGRREPLDGKYTLIIHNKEILAPFSWMKYVVISEKDLNENGREILIHELAHVRNRHSIDLLIADICIFFQWFNSASWLMKQELQNIHEYEADETVIKEGVGAKQYQLLLIKKAVGTRLYSMANSFNHSKLKKRIAMMLKEKSSPWARLKYLYILPLMAVAITAFARPEISKELDEISAVNVNDLATIAETKTVPPAFVVDRPVSRQKALTVDTFKVVIDSSGALDSEVDAPLIFIDGQESSGTVLSALNPEFIESISVLKDKSAVETYGERGANGVVLVTLKKEDKLPKTITKQKDNPTKLLVRGKRTGDPADVLVLYDGVEMKLEDIDQAKVESIEVIKDASVATAQQKEIFEKYGDKAKNGIIFISSDKIIRK